MLWQAVTFVDEQLVRVRQDGIAADDRTQIFDKLIHKSWQENSIVSDKPMIHYSSNKSTIVYQAAN